MKYKTHQLLKTLIGGVEAIAKNNQKEGSDKKEPKNSKTAIIIIVSIGAVIAIVFIILIIIFTAKYKLNVSDIGLMFKYGIGPAEIKYKRDNFSELRCKDNKIVNNPQDFGPKNITYQINKAYCDTNTALDVHEKNIAPIQGQLNTQNRMMEKMRKQAENQNKMILHIRKSIEKQYKDIYQKLINLYKRLAYVFKVFARLFYKIFVVFKDIFTVLKYAIWTLASMWDGPIGNTVRVLCFGEETIIKVDRNNSKIITKISDVEINDVIDKSDVIGICKFLKQEGNDFYKLDKINVAGSHLIEYEDKLIRVCDHPESIKNKYNGKYIYSLITNNGLLKIGRFQFRDHLGDNTLETYLNFVKPICNENVFENINKENYELSALNLYPGFTCNSYLQTNKGIKKIENIELEETINGKKIIGIIKYKLEGKTLITPYNIDEEHSGMLVGIQFFKEDNYKVGHKEERWILGKLECIGLLIEGAIIKVSDKIMVADFDIVSDDARAKAEQCIA